ncbi:MAG: HetZ-related protein [Leptolyngbyaceae cyanobacterium MO_188.B28]|nr:HetZ-related protein [Leptolyngbyaceae cyanobacterium MO_188.B28]
MNTQSASSKQVPYSGLSQVTTSISQPQPYEISASSTQLSSQSDSPKPIQTQTGEANLESPQPEQANLPDENEPSAAELKIIEMLCQAFRADIAPSKSIQTVASRMAAEVIRICLKSDRIQSSGEVNSWQQSLAEHRLKKCLEYYRLGSSRGRVELHSRLSAIAYRYISPNQAQLGFQGRYILLEDFLQNFYIEVIKAFRRENQLPVDYTPRTRLELAEYMAFSEQYAKRRISLPGCHNQQLIVLRAQAFAKRQPQEASVDIEMAVESGKTEDAESYSRSPVVHQIREQMVADAIDPADAVLRDRVIRELIQYLQEQNQEDCIDYLTLRLQDLSASEIDDILGLTSRQRDYLQQRFKYHVEKFSQVQHWELVHQWLGADLDQNLGIPSQQWQAFVHQLDPEQCRLLELKQQQASDPDKATPSDTEIAKTLGYTPKRLKRNWGHILSQAWKFRNQMDK